MCGQEQIRLSQAKADEYKARGYRSQLEAAYTRLKLLKDKVKGAPAALHTAELNERLAEQSDERVGERLKISAEKQETDEALIRKNLAMERVVRRKMAELKPLEATQIKAVRTASKAAMSEDRVVDRESSRIHGIMQKVMCGSCCRPRARVGIPHRLTLIHVASHSKTLIHVASLAPPSSRAGWVIARLDAALHDDRLCDLSRAIARCEGRAMFAPCWHHDSMRRFVDALDTGRP